MTENPGWRSWRRVAVIAVIFLQALAISILAGLYHGAVIKIGSLEENRELRIKMENSVIQQCELHMRLGDAYRTALLKTMKGLGLDLNPNSPSARVLDAYGIGGGEDEDVLPTVRPGG